MGPPLVVNSALSELWPPPLKRNIQLLNMNDFGPSRGSGISAASHMYSSMDTRCAA